MWWLFETGAQAEAAQTAVFETLGHDTRPDNGPAAVEITVRWDVPRQDINGLWVIAAKVDFPIPNGATEVSDVVFPVVADDAV